MRFVSKYQKYSVVVQGVDMAMVNGMPIETSTPVIVNFDHGGIMDWEKKAAMDHFGDLMRGLPIGVPGETRLSVADTEMAQLEQGWTDEQREKYEQVLLNNRGGIGVDYILVEEPRTAIPWGSYDEEADEDIIPMVVRLKIDPDKVYRYEFENQKRSGVLQDLDALRQAEASDEEIVVA